MKTTEMMVELADKLSTAETELNQVLSMHHELNDIRNNIVFIQASIARLTASRDPEAIKALRAIDEDMRDLLKTLAFI